MRTATPTAIAARANHCHRNLSGRSRLSSLTTERDSMPLAPFTKTLQAVGIHQPFRADASRYRVWSDHGDRGQQFGCPLATHSTIVQREPLSLGDSTPRLEPSRSRDPSRAAVHLLPVQAVRLADQRDRVESPD